MSEPGCGPGPLGVIRIIADLGIPTHALENRAWKY
jgi:hypothetical protein